MHVIFKLIFFSQVDPVERSAKLFYFEVELQKRNTSVCAKNKYNVDVHREAHTITHKKKHTVY
jgi:hypothetical protein